MNGYQFVVTLAASCGGLLYGYEIGVMNVVLVMDAFRTFFDFSQWKGVMENEMKDDIKNTFVTDKSTVYRQLEEKGKKPFLEGFITSSFLFGAIFGALISSYLSNTSSSQKIIMVTGLIFSLGSLIQSATFYSFILLSLGRFISGMAIGGISVLCPTYIAEVAPARIRNTVISCYQFMVALGIVVATAINGLIWYHTNVNPTATASTTTQSSANQTTTINNMEWRLALGLQIVPGLLLTLFTYFLPTSPRYLCSQNKDKEAIRVLAKLNSTSSNDLLVQEEYKATIASVTGMEALGKSTYKELFNRRNGRRSFTAFFIQFFQQCTGINAILYYQTQLYQGVGFSKIMSTVILPILNNCVYFVSSFIGMFHVQRMGRKQLLIIGGVLLLLINISISSTANHTLDHFKFRLNEEIDCTRDKHDMAYFSKELQYTFYGNDCHETLVTCSDQRNVISYDPTTTTTTVPFTSDQLYTVCHEMDALRYAKGNFRRYLFAGSLFAFMFVYGCTWDPVPKVYQAELFPLRMRVKGMTFSTVSQFISSWIIVLVTPLLLKVWGMHVFLLFSACCYLALMFTLFFCVESNGLSMEEIDEEMMFIKS
ncbi:general substrate transporter [Piromyces finnis]|uniref:General substrate transporter n=1 Tax=Piromyces finnis TaxID=1754191 RepID=A0A1Y1V2J4_9FUNG|nr:general substrate transporter [Piromyces finnis]|eukprot:ORX45794.1 general substrate transporter [Piromyces finnis]